jgi:hypothetical protein
MFFKGGMSMTKEGQMELMRQRWFDHHKSNTSDCCFTCKYSQLITGGTIIEMIFCKIMRQELQYDEKQCWVPTCGICQEFSKKR